MELLLRNLILVTTLVLAVINLQLHLASGAFGVNYGMLGDNLPPPQDVINLYKNENIQILRLFEPKPEALEALRGSDIRVVLGVRNEDVVNFANDFDTVTQWVNTNVVPYAKDVNFGWISVGNEMVPDDPNADHIPNAMKNLQNGLNLAGLTGIKVSTVVHGAVLGVSYPPSAGDFSSQSSGIMSEIIDFLASSNNPLLVNVYPYFAYASDPTSIPLGYALFNPDQPVIDGEYKYYSLFEAMVDAFYAALEKHGGGNVNLVVSETGWPTAGGEPSTGIQNAQTYNQNLINKMKVNGTPRRPSSLLDIIIFAMFNEDQKPSGIEQHWGIHYPDKTPVYPLTF